MAETDELRQCEGFLAFAVGERCGIVRRVLLSPEGDPEALAIHLGGLADGEEVVAEAGSVARCDRKHGHLFLRDDWRARATPAPSVAQRYAPPSCTLAYALGRVAECPREACAFWQGDGDGGCSLGALEPALHRSPEAASFLLGLRERVESRG